MFVLLIAAIVLIVVICRDNSNRHSNFEYSNDNGDFCVDHVDCMKNCVRKE